MIINETLLKMFSSRCFKVFPNTAYVISLANLVLVFCNTCILGVFFKAYFNHADLLLSSVQLD